MTSQPNMVKIFYSLTCPPNQNGPARVYVLQDEHWLNLSHYSRTSNAQEHALGYQGSSLYPTVIPYELSMWNWLTRHNGKTYIHLLSESLENKVSLGIPYMIQIIKKELDQ